jgi:hypothetical protein
MAEWFSHQGSAEQVGLIPSKAIRDKADLEVALP